MEFDLDTPSHKEHDLKTTLNKERFLSRFAFLHDILRAFSPGERLVMYALAILLGVSTLALLAGVNAAVSETVPAQGGTLIEGEVGPARFINPILALSQPDQDLSLLVYSGLTRIRPDGTVVPDLASSYEISQDGATYTFTMRPDATFQDGTPVTAADVLFTVQAAQNPGIKSTHRADWEGVQVSAPDAYTVVFKLSHAYAPFIENTSLGILPKHIWQNVSAEEFPFNPANTHPIGSGPYRISGSATDAAGSPTRYDLEPFTRYTLGAPFLRHITFIFYPNQETMVKAFDAHKIDAIAGIKPDDLQNLKRTDFSVVRAPLPRVFAVFFNQSRAPVLADAAARAALDAAVDKQEILATVLHGYGAALNGPIPPGATGAITPAVPYPYVREALTGTSTPSTAAQDTARGILSRGGWTFDEKSGTWKKKKLELSFTLATADEPELVATANAVATYWRAAGVDVSVQVYSLSELNTNVLRPRAYDAVLFGEIVGRTTDLFAFWHSSQRNDPGLNLALYTNASADSLLTQARSTTDKTQRSKLYAQFSSLVAKDDPAVFLYSPEFIYLVPQSLHGVELGALTSASERFFNVYQWYTQTEKVWSIFTNQSN